MSYEFLKTWRSPILLFLGKIWELFQAAGDATINTMIENLDSIKPKETRTFSLENDALDLLLFNFLELIYYKDSEQLLLRAQRFRSREKWITAAKRSCSRRDARLPSAPTASKLLLYTVSNWKKQ